MTRSLLDRLETDYPGVRRLAADVAAYFVLDEAWLRASWEGSLAHHDEAALRASCAALEAVGVFPDIDVHRDDQVAAMWQSPMFCALLDALAFTPPPATDLRPHLPRPASTPEEMMARLRPGRLGEVPYWKVCLARTFPELYLRPDLEALPGAIEGCELACGWGRGSFSLGVMPGLTVHCCDISEGSLRALEALASSAGFTHLRTRQCDITALPYPDETFHFFMAFDLFEHLTDAALDAVLREVLRCARPGALLYTEIPLHAKCPAITHLQDFALEPLVDRFTRLEAHGRTFRLMYYHPVIDDHFTFAVKPLDSSAPH